jgi:hypothetical protein
LRPLRDAVVIDACVAAAGKARGIVFALEAGAGTGPAAAMTFDPDRNAVLFDQH